MKKSLIVLWLLLFPVFWIILASSPGSGPETLCSNYIIITGRTNINSFRLSHSPGRVSGYSLTNYEVGNYTHMPQNTINIPVKQFEADNHMIYKDFLQLVKASDYPNISIRFPQLNEGYVVNEIKNVGISITIAGVTRFYNISCASTLCDKETTFLYGSQKLHLTDFNIDPPEKTFGLIKVKDEVIINFGFTLAVQ